VEHLFSGEGLVAFLTLAALEIVLGIDNIVFIAILSGKLPPEKRQRVRIIGLLGAMVMRILLLLVITWIMQLDKYELFTIPLLNQAVSGKDLVLIVGGLFLLAKATYEIHDKLEAGEHSEAGRTARSVAAAVVQIMLIDLVFSVDSVITAVGMAKHVEVMIAAVVASVLVMLAFSGPICAFIEKHPTIKILALSFLLLIGMMLVVDGLGQHVSKGYIYFAMGFSLFVEALNIRFRRKHQPLQLHRAETPAGSD
jgi:predicted tellurium resistance membrane protein TerC